MAVADAPLEILVFEDADRSLASLTDSLRFAGHRVDVATTLEELTDAFVAAGGHAAVILAPGLHDALAARAAQHLGAVSPELRVLVFGHAARGAPWPESGIVRLGAHHPAAVTALGAVLRQFTNPAR